jgi:hypothetical protein
MMSGIEGLPVTGINPDPSIRLNLRDLSQVRASEMIGLIIDKMMSHAGWSECDACPLHDAANACPIIENRCRLQNASDGAVFQKRLTALVELSEQNGVHFPVRQLLALVTNILLGHPKATDGPMSCGQVAEITAQETLHLASIYRNVFGENLSARRAEKTDLFRKLAKIDPVRSATAAFLWLSTLAATKTRSAISRAVSGSVAARSTPTARR